MEDFQVDVSVCMMTYFHEKYIRQAIDSVIAQKTTYSFEIIIADDASKDQTVHILLEYQRKYPKLIKLILNKENLGITQNSYNLKCSATGRYITGLSGDDYWIDSEKIQKQVDFLKNHPEYLAVVTGVELRMDDSTLPYEFYPHSSLLDREITLEMYLKGKGISTHGLMMRNVLLTEQGKQYFEVVTKASEFIDDSTECILLLTYGRIYTMGFAPVVYRMQEDRNGKRNYNSQNNSIKHYSNMIALYSYLDSYFDGSLNLFHLFKINISRVLLFNKYVLNFRLFWNTYVSIPKRYRKKLLLIRSIIYSVQLALNVIIRKIEKRRRHYEQ